MPPYVSDNPLDYCLKHLLKTNPQNIKKNLNFHLSVHVHRLIYYLVSSVLLLKRVLLFTVEKSAVEREMGTKPRQFAVCLYRRDKKWIIQQIAVQ